MQFSGTFGTPLVSHDRIRHELFERPHFNKDELSGDIAKNATKKAQTVSIWQEWADLLQTFEELERVKNRDEEDDIQAIRKILGKLQL